MVVTTQNGQARLTIRGPETTASPAPVPENAEFFGIQFRLGTCMPQLPAKYLVDNAITMPEAAQNSVWLRDSV